VLDAEDILNGIVRGALGGGRKSGRRASRAYRGGGLVNAKTLLAAAGVAWGLFETWQNQQQTAGTSGGAQPATGGFPAASAPGAPPPLPSTAAAQRPAPAEDDGGVPPAVAQLLRIMISAARADGELGEPERERILREAREVGAEELVRRELDSPRPLGELVAGASDPELKQQLYTLAFVIVRADESVTGGERIYLAQLANRLGLDAATVARLEAEAAGRIDATPPGADTAE
jgi:uncharacterized membrane protein YebE (DUF533 family)